MGAQKLGQPVPESNFVSELKSAVSQQIHRNNPLSWTFKSAPVNAISVPALRVISNEAGVSSFRHSASLLTIFGTTTTPCRTPASENSTMRTILGGRAGTPPASTASGLWARQSARPASAVADNPRNTLRLILNGDLSFVISVSNILSLQRPGEGCPPQFCNQQQGHPWAGLRPAKKPTLGSAPLASPLKGKRLLFGHQENGWPAGRNRNGVSHGLLSSFRRGALLERLHRGEINLCDAVERRSTLGRRHHFGGNKLGFAGQFLHCHGHVLLLVNLLECFNIFGAGIDHDKFRGCHVHAPFENWIIRPHIHMMQAVALKSNVPVVTPLCPVVRRTQR